MDEILRPRAAAEPSHSVYRATMADGRGDNDARQRTAWSRDEERNSSPRRTGWATTGRASRWSCLTALPRCVDLSLHGCRPQPSRPPIRVRNHPAPRGRRHTARSDAYRRARPKAGQTLLAEERRQQAPAGPRGGGQVRGRRAANECYAVTAGSACIALPKSSPRWQP